MSKVKKRLTSLFSWLAFITVPGALLGVVVLCIAFNYFVVSSGLDLLKEVFSAPGISSEIKEPVGYCVDMPSVFSGKRMVLTHRIDQVIEHQSDYYYLVVATTTAKPMASFIPANNLLVFYRNNRQVFFKCGS